MKIRNVIILLAGIIAVNVFVSCTDEQKYSSSSKIKLQFSTDTVSFDTVFTAMSSVTKQIKVYNPYSDAVKIDYITLGSGAVSFFRLNVDGDTSLTVRNVELLGKDSLFIFVKVELNPNNQSNPLLVEDSIIFSFNGKTQSVLLSAYGQDAYYHKSLKDAAHTLKMLEYNSLYNRYDTVNFYYSLANEGSAEQGIEVSGNNIVWKNDKPHVIIDNMVVDSAYTLNLTEGTKIYMGNGSEFWVYTGGSLKARGTTPNPVEFLSLRMQDRYADIPGQWGRIWLWAGSYDNVMDNTVIKNAVIGLQVDTVVNNNHTLELTNTIIANCSQNGLLARGADIYSYNLLVYNTGGSTVKLTMGGSYEFIGCTFANYWSYDGKRNEAVLQLNDYYIDNTYNVQLRRINKADFYNTVIYGSAAENEIDFDLSEDLDSQYLFDHCLVKYDNKEGKSSAFKNCVFNKDPLFVDYTAGDFHTENNSPVIGCGDGIWNNIIPYDIFGIQRLEPPSAGAVENRSRVDG